MKNSQEIKLRCILIQIDRTLKKSTARFGQFAATARSTAHDKPSPKDPNGRFFSSQSSRLSTQLDISTRGTKWNVTWHSTWCATSQKSAEGLSAYDMNHPSDELVSK